MLKLNNLKQLHRIIRMLAIPHGISTASMNAANNCISREVLSPLFVLQQRRQFGVTFTLEKRRENKKSNQDTDMDSDEEDEVVFKDERDSKVIKANLNSLRADLLLKAGLGIARNKIENIFYESRIRVNGRKLPKKSAQLNDGDEIDVIRGFSQSNSSHLVVSRVIILSSTAREEGLSVHLRRYKSLLVENYNGADAFKTSGSSEHV